MFCIFGRLKLSCLWKTLINDAALLKGLPDQNCRWHNLMMSLHALKKKNHIFSWNVHHISKWFSRNFNLLSCDSISHNLQKSCSKERKYFWTKTKKLHSNKFLPQMLTWLILLHKKTPQICYISAKSLHLVEYGQVKFTCIYFPSWLKINPWLYIFQLVFTLNYCFMLVEGEESFEISWKLR